jgi:hypothetical protein
MRKVNRGVKVNQKLIMTHTRVCQMLSEVILLELKVLTPTILESIFLEEIIQELGTINNENIIYTPIDDNICFIADSK